MPNNAARAAKRSTAMPKIISPKAVRIQTASVRSPFM